MFVKVEVTEASRRVRADAALRLSLLPATRTGSLLEFRDMDPYSAQNYYQQYYQQQNPQAGSSSDVNPYHQPYQGPVYSNPTTSSSHSAPVPANAYEYDVGILAQQSVYVPGAAQDKRGGAGGKLAKGGKRVTVLRKGGGKEWEDQTLLEWNPCTCPPNATFLLH